MVASGNAMAAEIVVRVVQDTMRVCAPVAERIDADAAKASGRPGCEGRRNL
jgi:hypothetical protein